MCNKYIKTVIKSQSGYASFVITLITMIVVGLIVVAFSADSRLEQKNSLANTLATQAYYAAESGIQDADALISAEGQNGIQPNPTPAGTCTTPGYGFGYINFDHSNNITSNGSVSYSCINVNTTPTVLKYPTIPPGQSQVIPLAPTPGYGAGNIAYITISWQESNSPTDFNFTGCPDESSATANNAVLPTFGNYPTTSCGAGVLQVDLISQDNLANEESSSNPFSSQAATVYLVPEQDNSTGQAGNPETDLSAETAVGSSATNTVVPVMCTANNPASDGEFACTDTIEVTPDSGATTTQYYVHLQSFYEINDVDVSAQNNGGSGVPTPGYSMSLSNAQAIIDSTGYANGQEKRLEETVCTSNYCNSTNAASSVPGNAIQSDGCIYKQFTVYPSDSDVKPTDPNPGC